TGGGLGGNLPRVLPPDLGAVVRQGSWPVPRIFDEVQRAGNVTDEEMARVFNLGLGMVVAVSPSEVPAALAALAGFGIEAVVVGEVVAGDHAVTTI
ncbi:MAG TPA: AIR synthase-related protein, partial [Acidimicrobiales bacterium]|nr:AIR synthase-related protein [Acidimicrobiales bacterium]